MVQVMIPIEKLSQLEEARVALFDLADKYLYVGDATGDSIRLSELLKVTSVIWEIANRKWPEVSNANSTTQRK